MYSKLVKWSCLFLLLFVLTACTDQQKLLNPDKPITVSLWHYYNGTIKEEFDTLVSEFNETVGTENGVIIETQSYGEIPLLETALFEAANESVGSLPMPDIFAAYSDYAYQLARKTDLVPLENYFSDEELAAYRTEFLKEGQFLADGKSYILPVAKSTENLFINKTDWEPFAYKHQLTNDVLQTWEGIYQVAEIYYKETGKSFFSHDSFANFIFTFSKQFGDQLFSIDKEGNASFTLTEEGGKAIWDYLYRPYLYGYFKKEGRFSSDDAKTGEVIAFISSTSGAGYFPKDVTIEQSTYEIEPLVLPYPYIHEDNQYVVQQGAGMSITKSEETHEYGAALFLKWFTEIEQNMSLSIQTGYLPVKNEIYENDLLIQELEHNPLKNKAITDSFIVTNQMLKNYTFFNNPPFSNSDLTRNVIEKHLYDKIINDLEILTLEVKNGRNRSDVLQEMISDEQFSEWFTHFKEEIESTLH